MDLENRLEGLVKNRTFVWLVSELRRLCGTGNDPFNQHEIKSPNKEYDLDNIGDLIKALKNPLHEVARNINPKNQPIIREAIDQGDV